MLMAVAAGKRGSRAVTCVNGHCMQKDYPGSGSMDLWQRGSRQISAKDRVL